MAKNWFELGLACTLLGQYETNQQEDRLGQVLSDHHATDILEIYIRSRCFNDVTLSVHLFRAAPQSTHGCAACAFTQVFSKLGNTADRLSVLLTQKVEEEQIQFVEQLKDQLRLVDSVKQMMKTRNNALSKYQSSLSVLEARQTKLASTVGAAEEKSVIEAQAAVDIDKRELQKITELCLAEAEKFKLEKRDVMKQVVMNYVKHQIEQSKKVQNAWETLATSLQGV